MNHDNFYFFLKTLKCRRSSNALGMFVLWDSLTLCNKDEREEGVPSQGLSRESREPEAGCGVLIGFHSLKVPRDYKFPSCTKQPDQLLISANKPESTHTLTQTESEYFYCTEYFNPSICHWSNSRSYSVSSTSLIGHRKVLLALMWESVPVVFS